MLQYTYQWRDIAFIDEFPSWGSLSLYVIMYSRSVWYLDCVVNNFIVDTEI